MTDPRMPRPCCVVVFQEAGSGEHKIAGIEVYGKGISITRVHDIPSGLEDVIDEPEAFIPHDIEADLVLSFLRHPDLSEYLVRVCQEKGIPVVASGRHIPGAITPFTCCGLGRRKDLNAYGDQFGVPEYEAGVADGRLCRLVVKRGASCGATWQVVQRLLGLPVKEALGAIGREVQYLCMADPSAFDPISGKSALHFAGDVHKAALKKALKEATKKTNKG